MSTIFPSDSERRQTSERLEDYQGPHPYRRAPGLYSGPERHP
nr:MAG TPA: hypothetical protein [Caudoviricetes sp.]